MPFFSTVSLEARNERSPLVGPENDDWLSWTSVEDVWEHRPERIEQLLAALDLDRAGLEQVKAAVEENDLIAASYALLDYYAETGRQDWVADRLDEASPLHLRRTDDLLEDRVHFSSISGRIPSHYGAWDWNHTGPQGDREFAFTLNRHFSFIQLLRAWRKTGDERYAVAFDRLVRDWNLHTVYPGENHQAVWTWRVLEASLRMRAWTATFHGFAGSESFSPAGRILMLSSLVEHGNYIKRHHRKRHNHALMEHDGLNRLTLTFPEFRASEGWHQYALSEMIDELDHQVYPDGAHDELSSHYHWVSLNSFEETALICEEAGRAVPPAYRERLIDMYAYYVGLVRPDGSMPQINRSDRDDATAAIKAAAERYERPDWRYIITNGREGARPSGPPSFLARWAGHLVSRSGWDRPALWSFFNAGPAGANWVHANALHLSVTAFEKDFLVDSGRFWYQRDKWTDFAHGSRSKNVILIDGRGQKPVPTRAEHPLPREQAAITRSFDFARTTHNVFDRLQGEATHTRTVVFLREIGGWVVLDKITTDRPRAVTPLWHFRPERSVEITEGGGLITADPEGANLGITPVGNVEWKVELLRGQKEPYLQGWHSDRFAAWEPTTSAEFSGTVDDDGAVFGWLIFPVSNGPPVTLTGGISLEVVDQVAHLRFTHPDHSIVELEVPLARGPPVIRLSSTVSEKDS